MNAVVFAFQFEDKLNENDEHFMVELDKFEKES